MTPISDKKIVAVTGYARCGKNSFATEIQSQLKWIAPNLIVEQFSFAASLRCELDSFIRENFNNISPWTEDEKEKALIRPLLIAYGNAKRQISNGQYWIEKLHRKIEQSKCDVALITDLRYAENDNDELGWLKKNRGFNFHLRRYSLSQNRTTKEYVKRFEKAPNEYEEKNDPKLEANAKKVIEIPRFETLEEFNKQIKEEVESIIGYFL
jgi:hypothetical protein